MAHNPSDSQDPQRSASSDRSDLGRTPPPKTRSSSLGDSHWFEDIPELPPPEAGNPSPSFLDQDFDLPPLGGSGGPSSPVVSPNPTNLGATTPPRFDADDAMTDQVDFGAKPEPLQPASGWLAGYRGRGPAAPIPAPEPSDIFSGSNKGYDSELLGSEGVAPPSGSHIFTEADELSEALRPTASPLNRPSDGDVLGNQPTGRATRPEDGDDLYLAFDQPPSELFLGTEPPEEGSSVLTGPSSGFLDDGSKSVNALLEELDLSLPTPTNTKASSSVPPASLPTLVDPHDVDPAEDAAAASIEADLLKIQALLADDADSSVFGGRAAADPLQGSPSSEVFPPRTEDLDVVAKAPQSSSFPLDELPEVDSDLIRASESDGDPAASIFDLPEAATAAQAPTADDAIDFNLPKRRATQPAANPNELQDDLEASLDWTMPSQADHSSLSSVRPINPASSTDHFDAFLVDTQGDDATSRLGEPPPQIHAASKSAVFPRPSSSVLASGSRNRLGASSASSLSNPKLERPSHGLDVNQLPRRTAMKPSRVGWFAGGALGLVAGLGLSAGVFFSGLLESSSSPGSVPIRRNGDGSGGMPPGDAVASAPTSLTSARQWLALGDAQEALPLLEAAGPNAPPVIIGERGKARWIIRIRQLGAEREVPTADDPLLAQALEDLRQVVDRAAELTDPADQRVALEAALRIGLTYELQGNLPGATAHYTDAIRRFPQAKTVFETALRRLKAFPAPPSASPRARLKPAQAEELTLALMPALFLLQDPNAADSQTLTLNEAGFLFWEAINEASVNNFAKARSLILKARQVHDQQRLTLVGRGLNPLSDPLEQIFLRACMDLNAFWVVKEQLYTHPTAGPLFAKNGLNKITASLDQLAKSVATDPKQAETLVLFQQQLDTARQQLQTLESRAETLTSQAKEAQARALASQEELQRAQMNLAQVLQVLRANQLVAAEADLATGLKALPAKLQQLAKPIDPAAVGNLDLAKLKTSLADATARLAAAEKDLKTKTEQTDQLQTELAALKKDYEGKLASVDEQLQKTLAKLQAEQTAAKAKLATVQEELTKQTQSLQQKLVQEQEQQAQAKARLEQEQKHRQQLEQRLRELQSELQGLVQATARPANPGRPTAPLLRNPRLTRMELARTEYDAGLSDYFAGRFPQAIEQFSRAIEHDEADARYHYFLGLARLSAGQADYESAFRRGASLEKAQQPQSREVRVALERIQGPARVVLNQYRP